MLTHKHYKVNIVENEDKKQKRLPHETSEQQNKATRYSSASLRWQSRTVCFCFFHLTMFFTKTNSPPFFTTTKKDNRLVILICWRAVRDSNS